MDSMKTCGKCLEIKSIEEFYKSKPMVCKLCIQSQQATYRAENSGYLASYFRNHYEANKEEILDARKTYYQHNKVKINQYVKDKYHSDPLFKLATNLRKRMSKMITRNQKSGSAVKDLGCSIDEFKQYIESLFQPGMTWDNYGEWHLDHIFPLSKFDLSVSSEFKKACHYSNLQPLWAQDNLKKSNKVA